MKGFYYEDGRGCLVINQYLQFQFDPFMCALPFMAAITEFEGGVSGLQLSFLFFSIVLTWGGAE